MSFDVFFQGFTHGESSERGGAEMRQILSPYVVEEAGDFLHIRTDDGPADVYRRDDGMMANHISGRKPWQLLLLGPQAANWVIMSVDVPTCLTQPGQREHLPEELQDNIAHVQTADELLALFESR